MRKAFLIPINMLGLMIKFEVVFDFDFKVRSDLKFGYEEKVKFD
jgi:hypothetical protein